jgi:Ni/Fe-hydrogenase subunit HybB-like protein
MIEKAFKGGAGYWRWVGFLLLLSLAGLGLYFQQLKVGLGITGMGRDVSWGLYIANFTFLVGVAASAVVVVLPYYLHNFKEFGRITILGEFLAVAAVVMSILFVFIDLGQPARVFKVIRYLSPDSLLFWDMVVLSIYFLLNILTGWYTLDGEQKEASVPGWVKPLIYLSIPWAVSIHTVTAFIYSGLVARPFWLSALLAPKFLASAFASGPSLLILLCLVIRKTTSFDPGKGTILKVARIVTYAMLITLFFFLVELFTAYYGNIPEEKAHFNYLFFGLEGKSALVPWAWAFVMLMVGAIVLLLLPVSRRKDGVLALASAAVIVSMWIDKGLGLLIPGFIPSPLEGVFEYYPTWREVGITIGVYGVGFLILTILFKVAVEVRKQTSKPVE